MITGDNGFFIWNTGMHIMSKEDVARFLNTAINQSDLQHSNIAVESMLD